VTLTIPATFQALEKITDFMMPLTSHLNPDTQSEIVLAVHELCMNIVQHAYAGDSGVIELQAKCDRQRLEVAIRDHGRNAYVALDEITPPNIHDYPESGWGIYIVHQVMDSVQYQRSGGQNQWYLVKNLVELHT